LAQRAYYFNAVGNIYTPIFGCFRRRQIRASLSNFCWSAETTNVFFWNASDITARIPNQMYHN